MVQLSRAQRASLNGVASLREKMARTGVTAAGQPLWTGTEVDCLKAGWPDMAALCRALPARTRHAIEIKAGRLGLTTSRRVWADGEVRALKPRYPTHDLVRDIAQSIEKAPRQVYGKANKIRLRRPRRRPKPVSDPILHSIRQRSFELNISLVELDAATRARGAFRRTSGEPQPEVIARAMKILGGDADFVFRR